MGSGATQTAGDQLQTEPTPAQLIERVVDVPGHGKYLLRKLNAKDFADYQAAAVHLDGEQATPDLRAAKFVLVGMMWIRPDGTRVISGPDQISQLYQMDAAVIDALYEAGSEMMSEGRQPIEDLVKN